MLEALVALLVLSFSALAYAALQIKGLSTNTTAMSRSKATQLAADMADRMRANVGAALAYKDFADMPAQPRCGSSAGSACAPDEMATLDVHHWRQTLIDELSEGSGIVCTDSTPGDGSADDAQCDGKGDVLAVKVFWKEKDEGMRVWTSLRP
jgi:type IV pilus assembly protein PilV